MEKQNNPVTLDIANPLSRLNGLAKRLCPGYFIKIITNPSDQQKEHQCTELLRNMLGQKQEWDKGYEDRILTRGKENYTYFVILDEKDQDRGIISGDVHPNLINQEFKGFNIRNFYIDPNIEDGQKILEIAINKIKTMCANIKRDNENTKDSRFCYPRSFSKSKGLEDIEKWKNDCKKGENKFKIKYKIYENNTKTSVFLEQEGTYDQFKEQKYFGGCVKLNEPKQGWKTMEELLNQQFQKQ